MKKSCYIFILITFSLTSCFGDVSNESIENCLIKNNRSECIEYFFSDEGAFNSAKDDDYSKLLTIKDKKLLKVLCDELINGKYDDKIKINLLNLAIINGADCACNYLKDNLINNNEYYKEVYKTHCSK